MKSNLRKRLIYERENNIDDQLYHLVQVKFAYNSNRIEGSSLTEEQTRFLYDTKTLMTNEREAIPIDDITEATNHFICFNKMLYLAEEELDANLIKEFHKILKTGTSDAEKGYAVGEWKTLPNMVGNIETTSPNEVQSEIDILLSKYNSIKNISFEDIIKLHHDFEAIHPFQDGNGRVGRIIAFKECLKHNITPFIIDEQFRPFYYRGLSEFNITPEFLIETCKTAQDQFQQWLNYFDGKADTLVMK